MNRRGFIVGGVGVIASSCLPRDDRAQKAEFDFIVVGSGAGGGPLAANLALRGYEVLLLEAGKDLTADETSRVPAFHPFAAEDPKMRWDFFVKHFDPGAEPEGPDSKFISEHGGILYPRAATLGGCTAHHTMVTVKPHTSDWDAMVEATGDDGWAPERMDRYWQRLEDCRYANRVFSANGHGFEGWLPTMQPDPTLALSDADVLKLARSAAAGHAKATGADAKYADDTLALNGRLSRDLNGPGRERDQLDGPFMIPLSTDGVARVGPREFIHEVMTLKPNELSLRTDALVSRVLFTDGASGKPRANGVEYLVGEHLYRADPLAAEAPREVRQVFARHEVILSAGAFNTPQLLKLSGIGPRTELEALSIPVVVDLPTVGTNLTDRYEVGLVGSLGHPLQIVEKCGFGELPDPCLDRWRVGYGPYTSSGAIVGVVNRSSSDKPEPDLFTFVTPGDFRGYFPGYAKAIFADRSLVSMTVLKAHTHNDQGRVTLRSADARDVPEIHFHSFSPDESPNDDVAGVVAGLKHARQLADEARARLGTFDEVWPGAAVSTDDELERFVRREAWGHHASCSCPAGKEGDGRSVLNGGLEVHGVERLRVVDASIFPKIPGFFIASAIYMASERAADLLDEAAKARS